MRFLVDASTGPAVARRLRAQQHDVFSVYDEARGPSDSEILRKSFDEDWILITNDKDFLLLHKGLNESLPALPLPDTGTLHASQGGSGKRTA